jgi:hypothetical protein
MSVSLIAGETNSAPSREIVYSATPRAIKNYTGIVVTNISKDITIEDILITVNDATSIAANTYLDIEGEEVFVKSKSGNVLTVDRGRDGTTILNHVAGAQVKSITSSDNILIPTGDDFGFSGSTT